MRTNRRAKAALLMSRHTTHPTSFDCWAPNRVKIQSRTVLCHAIVVQNNHTIRLDSCVLRHSPCGHTSRFGAVFSVTQLAAATSATTGPVFKTCRFTAAPSPFTAGDRIGTVRVAMLTRQAVSVSRAVQINIVIAPR